ncbi:MAG: fibronectin type III domain-containing protein [Saprospiraceae bacterium]
MKNFMLTIAVLFAHLTLATATETNTYANPEEFCLVCARPVGLLAANATGTSADLSWDAVPTAVSYTVVVENGQNNLNPFSVSASVTGTNYTIAGLTAGLNYKFKVRAHCSDGKKSNWSAWKQFNSSNAAPCTTPAGLAATSGTPGEATLTWGAVGGAQAYIIKVERGSGNPNPFNLLDTVTTNSLTVTGLVPGLNYKFKVRSLCFGGNTTAWTAWYVFATPATLGGPIVGGYYEYEMEAESREASTEFGAQISPNPVRGNLANLFVTGAEGQKVQAQLLDLTGKAVFSAHIQPEDNGWQQTLELPELPNGIYFLRTQMGQQIRTVKVLIGKE